MGKKKSGGEKSHQPIPRALTAPPGRQAPGDKPGQALSNGNATCGLDYHSATLIDYINLSMVDYYKAQAITEMYLKFHGPLSVASDHVTFNSQGTSTS